MEADDSKMLPDCEFHSNMSLLDRNDALYTNYQYISTVIIMPILLVTGLITNSSFIIMVYRAPDMRITINMYLVSLAVSDILFLISSIGDKIGRYLASPLFGDAGNRGTAGCIIVIFFINTSLMSSELHILMLAIERYYSVCVPLTAHINPRKRAAIILTSTWCVSASLALSFIPACADYTRVCLWWNSVFVETYSFCLSISFQNDIDAAIIYYQITQTFAFFVSVIASNILYVMVLRHLRRVNVSLQNRGMAHTSQYRNEQIRQHFNRMLCFNGLVYFFLLAPFNIYCLFYFASLINDDKKLLEPHVTSILDTTFRLLGYVNSCINPIVYGATNPRYRRAFISAFSVKRRPTIETISIEKDKSKTTSFTKTKYTTPNL
ncbi:neuropeptides capa receptor-like [Antedon mediterranea]|uniref:neuropeptides capa receptor-like n=1 Tax=Antedon mediterranea TaxID=105859 RepID=UPI003AF8EB44